MLQWKMSKMYSETGVSQVVSCNFCGKLLGREYYFKCHVCGATYCYIHIPKHSRAHRTGASIP